MDFILQLLTVDSVAHSIFVFSMVIALGLALGSIRFFGISLGVAGVLFSGLLFAHNGIAINHEVMDFTRELGLVLFVYTIGVQVGPGFFSSFKRNGLTLNLLAAFVVILGAVIAVILGKFGNVPFPAAVGIFSGATTNTPSLGAAQQAMKDLPGITDEIMKMPGLGYAIAYPFGIIGIILTMLVTRFVFRINPRQEAEEHANVLAKDNLPLDSIDLQVENSKLNGLLISEIPSLAGSGVVISRVMHEGKVQVPQPTTRIYMGDVVHLVGPTRKLKEFKIIIGDLSEVDVRTVKSDITARRIIITKPEIVGRTIKDLEVHRRYGVTVTRVSRAEIEFPVTPEIELHFADTLVVVGEESAIKRFAADIGNSPKHLDHPFVIPVFVGIVLGVLLGSWPIQLPGMPAPIKLGLAGGPLIVAIMLSRIGHIGRLIWYMPISANFMLREVGIVFFLACVGLKAGDQFVNTLVQGDGLYWMACGVILTLLPLLIVAFFARWKLKMNYMTLCGLLAGSMTDPPALAFANNIAASSSPSVSYATVYPMVMLLRVVCAQLLVLLFL